MSYQPIEVLKHILIEIDYLLSNSDISEEVFMYNDSYQWAFVRCLEIIGEAVEKLPDDVKYIAPDVLWNEIASMRNRLIHDNFGVDYSIVWDVVKNEIPI